MSRTAPTATAAGALFVLTGAAYGQLQLVVDPDTQTISFSGSVSGTASPSGSTGFRFSASTDLDDGNSASLADVIPTSDVGAILQVTTANNAPPDLLNFFSGRDELLPGLPASQFTPDSEVGIQAIWLDADPGQITLTGIEDATASYAWFDAAAKATLEGAIGSSMTFTVNDTGFAPIEIVQVPAPTALSVFAIAFSASLHRRR